VVIQEFADGSLVRMCTECAAGADLGRGAKKDRHQDDIVWPESPPEASAAGTADSDPLEKTRELLMPVVDLIALQREMQGALERLAASLERFAAEMITESQDKSAVESRLRVMEQELDKTRRQLSEAESVLDAAGAGSNGAPGATSGVPDTAAAEAAAAATAAAAAGAPAAAANHTAQEVWNEPAKAPAGIEAPVTQPVTWPNLAFQPATAKEETQTAQAAGELDQPTSFRIDEVQAAQRYFNESPFTNRVRDVRRSLGKPKANVSRFPGPDPLAVVTVTWDIVWYQYLVDLRRDFSTSAERVSLYREGMDLDELPYDLREKNAVINDDGRLDASELEVKLLSDPSALITEMSPDETKLMDDATEEVWDKKISPEFKWDD
jgi:hypothetical protein